MVNGNTERSLRTEEHMTALAAEVQSGLSRQFSNPGVKHPDNVKRAEVTYNKAGWHVPSKHSSAAPTPVVARWRYWYNAYIVTLLKYHGHKGRGTTTARPECGSTALRGSLFCLFLFLYTFRTQLFGRPVPQYTRRTHDAIARETTSHIKCPGGLYNELNTHFA